MNVVAIQLDIAWCDKLTNFARAEQAIAEANPEPGSLVVLPEMFATGFVTRPFPSGSPQEQGQSVGHQAVAGLSMDVGGIAEGPDGPTGAMLGRLASEHEVYLIAGLVAPADGGRGRNIAVVYDPAGQRIATYTKLHPFSFAGETDFYEPGDSLVVTRIGEVPVCPLICYDLRFPEPFRLAARRGAQVFVVIANWPAPRADHWRALLIARAIENQACVIGVNRTGSAPNHDYAGGSMIVDHQGNILAEGDAQTPLVRATLDLPALETWRSTFPALKDIREVYPEPAE